VVHQRVGERGQQQPELVGLEPMAARTRAKQIDLTRIFHEPTQK
jgi:hypothetical protein